MVQKLSGVMMQTSQTIVAFQIWLDKSYYKFVSGKSNGGYALLFWWLL